MDDDAAGIQESHPIQPHHILETHEYQCTASDEANPRLISYASIERMGHRQYSRLHGVVLSFLHGAENTRAQELQPASCVRLAMVGTNLHHIFPAA